MRNLNRIFYVVIVSVSIAGATQSTQQWLHWWLPFALIAVMTIELGGVTLAAHADRRRRMGERAIPARVLSAAVAGGAMAINYFGHLEVGSALFFTGATVTGYCVWLIDSAAARRDALRLAGKLPPVAPVYGVASWVRSFGVTYRARQLALVDPALDRAGSLAAARVALQMEQRTAAITDALQRRISEHLDPTMAKVAINTYDINEVATRLAAGADYDGWTGILTAELLPSKLHKAASPTVDETWGELKRRYLAAQGGPARILEPAPVVSRKPRSTWDGYQVVRMVLDGEPRDLIMKETGVSSPSLDRIRRVIGILKANHLADIPAKEKVRSDIVRFIRSEVSK